MGRSRTAQRDHRRRWPSAASTSTNWPNRRASPTPIRSTCSAISPSTRRLRTRRERAQRLEAERKDFFDSYGPEARQMLDELLEKYAEHGDAQFVLPDVLKVPPISAHGHPARSSGCSAAPTSCAQAVNELQGLLYAA